MQGTRSNFSVLFSVIDMDVAITATSFLASLDTCWGNDLFVCRCILDVTQVFSLIFVLLYNLGGVNPSSWVTLTAFLMAFIFFGGLGLGLRLICISMSEIVGLTLVSIPMFPIGFVFVLLDWFVAFWTFKVDFSCS